MSPKQYQMPVFGRGASSKRYRNGCIHSHTYMCRAYLPLAFVYFSFFLGGLFPRELYMWEFEVKQAKRTRQLESFQGELCRYTYVYESRDHNSPIKHVTAL